MSKHTKETKPFTFGLICGAISFTILTSLIWCSLLPDKTTALETIVKETKKDKKTFIIIEVENKKYGATLGGIHWYDMKNGNKLAHNSSPFGPTCTELDDKYNAWNIKKNFLEGTK